jgi:hypothetical protein
MADENGKSDGFRKYSRPPKIMWKGWTMPANQNLLTLFTTDDRSAARATAIGVIVFLMVCLKGSPTVGIVITGVVGSVLTFILNRWVRGKEPELISAYGVMIVILALALLLPVSIGDTHLYDALDQALKAFEITGLTSVTPVLFAIPITLALWYIKARFWDGNRISGGTIGWAAETAVIAGAIVAVVAWLPTSFLAASNA